MRKAFDTVCIMAKIFHVCIMVQTAWKAKARRYFQFEVKLGKKKDML